MNAIITNTIQPTDTEGLRIHATNGAFNVTIAYDHSLTSRDNHARAAMVLVRESNHGFRASTWVCCDDPTRPGFVFMPVDADQYTMHFGA